MALSAKLTGPFFSMINRYGSSTVTNQMSPFGFSTTNSNVNATRYLNFSETSTDAISGIYKTTGISCNPSTNTVTATKFVGDISANTINGYPVIYTASKTYGTDPSSNGNSVFYIGYDPSGSNQFYNILS